MDKPIEIRNWSFEAIDQDPYHAPELVEMSGKCICGEVYGHPHKPDGKRIGSSRILGAEGRLIHCESRNYLLVGNPHPEYMKWIGENYIAKGKTFDLENPFKIIGG